MIVSTRANQPFNEYIDCKEKCYPNFLRKGTKYSYFSIWPFFMHALDIRLSSAHISYQQVEAHRAQINI